MKKIIILVLLFTTNQAFSQFCETFNQYSPASGTNPNPIAVYNVLDNWGSRCSSVGYVGNGGSMYLQVLDEGCFSDSWVFNGTDFSGNWINGQQFSFDFNLLPGGQVTSITEPIYIYADGNDPQNANLVARYVLNDPITINDGWVTVIPQIALTNQGSLPNTGQGYWEMVTGSDWDYLIQNVQGISFLMNEAAFGIDDICMQGCEWPFSEEEGVLFADFPLCYDELPYVTQYKPFLNPAYYCEINGVTVMNFDPFYLDPQYFNLGDGTFTLDAPGEYVIELFTGDCYWTFELVIAPEIIIDLPHTYIACDGVFEEICAPSGANYTYQWYGPSPPLDESVLLGRDECFTPEEFGSYNLVVTDEYGCSSSHAFSVLEAIPEPALNDCIGEIISIDPLIYGNPDYEILWFHNADLVQTGGTTLSTSFTSGTITVEISYPGCPPVITSVELRPCCPEDLSLAIDCENQQIVLENYPANFSGLSISSWTFNGDPVSNQEIFSPTFTTIYGSGVYGVSVLLLLPNGEECRFEEAIVYREDDCCELGPTANAQFVNIENYETVSTIPYGNVEIPVLCDFTLNATSSICEEEYIINIAELHPETWTTNEIYPWTAFSGQAGMIDLANFVSFQPGQAYLLSYHAGPNGTTIHLPFIYGLDAQVEITNVIDSYVLEGTKYGNIEVSVIGCQRLDLDGSASACEDSYQITIAPFNPIFPAWNTTGLAIYNNLYVGQAPNIITVPQSVFNGEPTGYYLLTFAVGPVWTPTYKLIWWEECQSLTPPSVSMFSTFSRDGLCAEEQVSVYPNPTSDQLSISLEGKLLEEQATVEVYNIKGQLLHFFETSEMQFAVDMSNYQPGIFLLRVQSPSGVCTQRIVKE